MTFPILYPSEEEHAHRKSSIGQFKDYLSVWKDGSWAPIVFDQLIGIKCDKVKTEPVVITFGNDSYVYPEGHCTYFSDKWIAVDYTGVEERLLPECQGQGGEFYQAFVRANAFINFDDGSALGVHNRKDLRVGLSYVVCDETLPAVD